MHGIYIHIPFCVKKCFYCDFYSIEDLAVIDDYVHALQKEISKSKSLNINNSISSIFIGGGTPSLLKLEQLQSLFDTLQQNFTIKDNAEVSIEVNPNSLSKDFLVGIKNIGINRLSIGVQSFFDEELKFLQRIHNADIAERAVQNAQNSGFENINLDLIFSIPGQTAETWAYSLEKAVQLQTHHISAYSLTYEPETPLYNQYKKSMVQKQSENLDTFMYEYAMEYLSNQGFEHYEISNYSKPHRQCKHNLNYWNEGTYSGFGTAAHSFDGKTRYWNIKNVNQYIESIYKNDSVIKNKEELSKLDLLEEKIFLSIRCGKLDLKQIGVSTEADLMKEIETMKSNGYIDFKNRVITLTNKGFSLADEISLRLIRLAEKQ